MKSNIKALINLADDTNRRVKANAHNQETSDNKNHETKVAKLAEDIATLKKKLAEIVAENKEKEQSLRKVMWTNTIIMALYPRFTQRVINETMSGLRIGLAKVKI